ncbi:MAG: UbiH/UbiF/VisC/COQ6 family ubiquinone biosynthesis hydroxylase [Pseudomonadota bacterium]
MKASDGQVMRTYMQRFSPQRQALSWTAHVKKLTLDTMSLKKVDIAIVGGGLSGGLASLALADAGFECALIDAQSPEAMRSHSFDGRTTAIAYASARVFDRLGLWEGIEPVAGPIWDILVTDGRPKGRFRDGRVSPLHLHFDSTELENDAPLGWIVENRHLREALYSAIGRRDDISLIAPSRWTGRRSDAGRSVLTLDNDDQIEAALVVAADGRHSALRADAKIKVNHWRYSQVGIVATVAHELDHEGLAQEFFLPAGPFAILPMMGNRSSLVWTEQADAAPAFLDLHDDAFLHQITERFGDYLGDISLAGPRWSYPLAFHLSQSFIAPRLALIGDAARAIHPIAGQGYNLGVKDIAALTDVLRDGASLGLDIGALTTLARYQRWRRFDSVMLALGTDVLNKLFSNDIPPLRLARDIGMDAVGKIAPLRRFFMRQAGADLGDLPSLMAR